MPETRFTEFPAFSFDPKVRISGSASEIFFLTYNIKDYSISFVVSFIYDILRRITTFYEHQSVFIVVAHK